MWPWHTQVHSPPWRSRTLLFLHFPPDSSRGVRILWYCCWRSGSLWSFWGQWCQWSRRSCTHVMQWTSFPSGRLVENENQQHRSRQTLWVPCFILDQYNDYLFRGTICLKHARYFCRWHSESEIQVGNKQHPPIQRGQLQWIHRVPNLKTWPPWTNPQDSNELYSINWYFSVKAPKIGTHHWMKCIWLPNSAFSQLLLFCLSYIFWPHILQLPWETTCKPSLTQFQLTRIKFCIWCSVSFPWWPPTARCTQRFSMCSSSAHLRGVYLSWRPGRSLAERRVFNPTTKTQFKGFSHWVTRGRFLGWRQKFHHCVQC